MSELTILKNGMVVTLDESHRVIEDGSIVIEDDKILDVGKTADIEKKYKGDTIISAKKKAVLPGLVDLHYHSSIGRGICDDLPLDEWLNKFIWPKLREMNPEEAYAGALCSYADSIKSGTTCVNDMYHHMTKVAEAAEKIGIRAVLSSEVADEPEGLETIEDNERLFNEKNGAADGRISVHFAIEWVPIASAEIISKTTELAKKYKTGIHIHLNESLGELELSKKRHGKRPVELAYDLGVLGPDCVAVHCVWLTDAEIRMLQQTGTSVSHNPSSNAKLGSGVARIPDLIAAGVNVGLGHDSASCNNSRDMFEVMKWASLVHRAVRVDASLMPAKRILEMATRNGGKALHLNIGSIEPGKKADLILVNLAGTHFTPLILGRDFNLFSHLVYSAHGEDVDTSIIDGKIVMENRVLRNIDENEVVENATRAMENVLARIR